MNETNYTIKTAIEIFNTLNEEQKIAVYVIVGAIIEDIENKQ